MTNVLVPITSNLNGYKKLLLTLASNDDLSVFVGVPSHMYKDALEIENENVFVFEYKNGAKKEEILNSLSQYINEGELIILRKPLTREEFKLLLSRRENIVLCKKERSKFKSLFYKLWQKMLKFFLGVRLYDGDTSAMKFDQDVTAVLSQTNDLSFATRVDRWRGLEASTIVTQGQAEKAEVDKKNIVISSLVAFFAVLIAVVVTVCVSLYAKISIIVGLLLFCLDTISLATLLIMLVMIGFNCTVGKKHFERAEQVVDQDFVEGDIK